MPQIPKFELPDQEELIKKIGNNISAYRKEAGLTQGELAEKIGISQKLLSHYETGRRRISSEMLYHIAISIGISTDILLGISKDKSTSKITSLKLMKRFYEIEKLTESDQKALLRTIDNFLKGAKK